MYVVASWKIQRQKGKHLFNEADHDSELTQHSLDLIIYVYIQRHNGKCLYNL
jgi:hypothetical protein